VVDVAEPVVLKCLLEAVNLADGLAGDEHVQAGADKADGNQQSGDRPSKAPFGGEESERNKAADKKVNDPKHPPIRSKENQFEGRRMLVGIPETDGKLSELEDKIEDDSNKDHAAQDADDGVFVLQFLPAEWEMSLE
jgi:hypothetical protein